MTTFLIRALILLAMLGLLYSCGSDDDPVAPPGADDLTGTLAINGGDAVTLTADVTLTYEVADADSIRCRNAGDDWPAWEYVGGDKADLDWTLADGDGVKTVEMGFKAVDGRTLVLDDDIELDATRTRILILDDQGTEVAVETILTDAGYTVTMGGYYVDYTGTDFSAYDLVILLYGYEYGYEIAEPVQQGLKDFVTAGGVLLTTEWFTYTAIDSEDYDTLADILPLYYDGDYCDDGAGVCPETYTQLVAHPITEGLATPFLTPADWTYSFLVVHPNSLATNIQVLFEGSNSGAALGIGDVGTGHTIHWSMAGVYDGDDIWSTETERILTNIAAFAD